MRTIEPPQTHVFEHLPVHPVADEEVKLIYFTFTDPAADHKPVQGDDDVDHLVFVYHSFPIVFNVAMLQARRCAFIRNDEICLNL